MKRRSGILLHITSLPGLSGSGDVGASARRFLSFLNDSGQAYWQVLPVNPPGRSPGFSPYDSPSAFAGNPLLISPSGDILKRLLPGSESPRESFHPCTRADFGAAMRMRSGVLRRAFAEIRRPSKKMMPRLEQFVAENADWLEDWALFAALKTWFSGRPWTEWEPSLRNRRPSALNRARKILADEIAFECFVQAVFDVQWKSLRRDARALGVSIIGDLPMFVAHDSADVWSRRELFELDRQGNPRRVSGYPPDAFSASGQVWGHPQYRWPAHHADSFRWWTRRFTHTLERFDALRIDHFLGFTRTWSIPVRGETAAAGCWVSSPGDRILTSVRESTGQALLIAEDLGRVTDADNQLRNRFALPPMRVLQFGFDDSNEAPPHLPHNHSPFCVAYTGTHDNDTIAGWFRRLNPQARRRVMLYTGGNPQNIAEAAIRTVMTSPASISIIPMQDILGLGSRARMNTPGKEVGNWRWRVSLENLGPVADHLHQLVEMSGRL